MPDRRRRARSVDDVIGEYQRRSRGPPSGQIDNRFPRFALGTDNHPSLVPAEAENRSIENRNLSTDVVGDSNDTWLARRPQPGLDENRQIIALGAIEHFLPTVEVDRRQGVGDNHTFRTIHVEHRSTRLGRTSCQLRSRAPAREATEFRSFLRPSK
jgi:hypothetical protein